jgi:hypothetical protein
MPNSAVATPGQSTNTTLNFKREFSPLCSKTEISKWVNCTLVLRYQPRQRRLPCSNLNSENPIDSGSPRPPPR